MPVGFLFGPAVEYPTMCMRVLETACADPQATGELFKVVRHYPAWTGFYSPVRVGAYHIGREAQAQLTDPGRGIYGFEKAEDAWAWAAYWGTGSTTVLRCKYRGIRARGMEVVSTSGPEDLREGIVVDAITPICEVDGAGRDIQRARGWQEGDPC